MSKRDGPDPDFPPIRRTPLYEQVAESLSAFINVQQLKPGDRLLTERELAQRLGVSRTSVRQAITALRERGIVESRHGAGLYIVRSPDDVVSWLAHELLESHAHLPAIMEVREAIETQTARLAARRRTEDDLAVMDRALDSMAEAIEAGDVGAEADAQFHGAISRAARNALLIGFMEELAEPIDHTRRASLARPGRPPLSLAGHRLILEAIGRQEEEAAAQAMREHLELVADVALVPRPSVGGG